MGDLRCLRSNGNLGTLDQNPRLPLSYRLKNVLPLLLNLLNRLFT